MQALVARAPTRIDFGGGWTDVPPYSEQEGGFVCNLAIARYATVRLSSLTEGARPDARGPEEALTNAAMRLAGLAGVRARVHNDFPLGAGLGGSSAAGVAMMGAIESWRSQGEAGGETGEIAVDRSQLAEASRRVEVEELGIAGGRQDHYAAAYGGALALSFGTTATVRRLPLPPSVVHDLEQRCVVVYTGQSRMSGDTIKGVLDAYGAGETRVLQALARMKALAREMADALAAGDLDALGMQVEEHWVHQRALHPAITTPLIDRIVDAAAAAGAIGAKALGASGGGCVLLVASRGAEAPVRRAVEGLAELLPFAIDQHGFAWWPPGDPLSPIQP